MTAKGPIMWQHPRPCCKHLRRHHAPVETCNTTPLPFTVNPGRCEHVLVSQSQGWELGHFALPSVIPTVMEDNGADRPR